MIDNVREISNVAWADIRFMRHTWVNVFLMSMMTPFLYLLAFGYGVGTFVNDIETDYGIMSYITFIIPGIIALTALSAPFSSVSGRMNVQRLYYRSFDEMMLCPLRFSSIAIGKAMMGIIRGLLSCSIIFILGFVFTHLTGTTGMQLEFSFHFVIVLLVSCFTFSMLGETAAFLAKSHASMATFSTLVILPMTFLCGTFFVISMMPGWFQAILYVLPLTYSSTLMRESLIRVDGVVPFDTMSWVFLIILIAMGLALLLLNIYLMKSRRI
ncbi:MAG: ABC transporter permease [Methanomassiliicoccaceae archaeon]|nr:ABC transporter permease [Methanomassiliicoccaceae archaeon]